jgi:hypothetical protein
VATNKYFNLYHQKNEQTLVQQLVEESVKIHGIDAVYIPRKHEKLDPIFREDVLSHFNDYHFLEVYIKNIDSFDGDQDIFKKFGLEIKNQITFSVSRSSFAKILGKEFIRPREGDLIYLPMSTATGLYEIKFVKEDSVFFTLGEFYIYDLQCELFIAENENIKVGIDEIDDLGTRTKHTIAISLGDGVGTFNPGEIAYQGESVIGADAKGVVVSFDGSTLLLKDVFGDFDIQYGIVKGQTAQYALLPVEEDVPEGQNKEFDENTVVFFNEHNPFSEEDY